MKWLLIVTLLFSTALFADEFEDEFANSGSSGVLKRADFEFYGGIELEQGHAISGAGPLKDANRDTTMANKRLKLKTMKTNDKGGLYAKVDIARDDVTNETLTDIRELRLQYRVGPMMDVSVGKQVSTWGVGDMLFINDLFPKNWNANFMGRDLEYLKDSSNSARVTSYLGPVTWDVVYTPKFAPDTTPTGCHLSTFNPNTGTIVTTDNNCTAENTANGRVSNKDDDSEIATALKITAAGQDLSLYGYRGFYKNPRNMILDGATLMPYYPRLNVYGFSSEGQVGPGVFTMEYGFYDNQENAKESLLLENDMHKYLVGYKIDLTGKLTVGAQVYGEYMTDYDMYKTQYEAAYGSDAGIKKENQLTYTLRVMYKMQQETLFLNLFTYYRPDDHDSFTKIDMTKRLDNNFSVVVGASIFTGEDNYESREFGMHRNDDMVYLRFKFDL